MCGRFMLLLYYVALSLCAFLGNWVCKYLHVMGINSILIKSVKVFPPCLLSILTHYVLLAEIIILVLV